MVERPFGGDPRIGAGLACPSFIRTGKLLPATWTELQAGAGVVEWPWLL